MDGMGVMIEAIKLLLFPAMMAFAASSDLLTMTIPNRVSLLMIGGFMLFAVATGMSLEQLALHVGCRLARPRVLLSHSSPAAGSAAAMPSSPPQPLCGLASSISLAYLLYGSIFGGVLTLALLQYRAIPLPAHTDRPRLGRAAARAEGWRALRHRARGRGHGGLSQHTLDAEHHRLSATSPHRSRCGNLPLTRFRYA